MFLRQSVLFTVTFLWNQTESALDNRNKTHAVALNHSSLPRPNENPFDGQTLLELQESATVNATNRVDQEDEARLAISPLIGHLRNNAAIFAANIAVTRKLPPALAFRALRVGKGQADLTTDEVLCILIKYASEYETPIGQERWYNPEKVFSLLVKTRPVDKVLDLFKAAGLQSDATKLRGLLYQDDFSELRKSMNTEWLTSRTKPDVVFGLLGLSKNYTPQPLNLYHWVLYCHQFKQKYGGKASTAKKIAEPLLATKTIPSLLLFREDFPFAHDPHHELMDLVNMIQRALYEGLIETEERISPLLACIHLRWYAQKDVLKLPTEGPFRALKAFTLAYTRRLGIEETAIQVFLRESPEEIFEFLKWISLLEQGSKKLDTL
uniref:RxLR effector candidate protein n=1 Tax=Hyaloperonospora arabidopsidis (strain Emoy2) TaxID=559515 RepID=M4BGM5_HYAAE|nr:RxLR effector candidate protein [Hyaloperonospora arabidopsidis Emoy2]